MLLLFVIVGDCLILFDIVWNCLKLIKIAQGGLARLKGDSSIMSYTGHSVLQTLIRCHFSPEHSTGTHLTIKSSLHNTVGAKRSAHLPQPLRLAHPS